MYPFYVSLASIEDVKKFVDAANHCPCEVDVLSGRYIINAKSIMGLFSIDLAKPVRVEVHGTQEQGDAFQQSVSSFTVPAPEQ